MWDFALSLPRSRNTPVFLQIARAITDEIRRGRLKPGDPIPGSRTLASSLHVHRNTVLAAYNELIAEGWLETSPAKGTFVSSKIPEHSLKKISPKARLEKLSARTTYRLPSVPSISDRPFYPPKTLILTGGVPDLRLVPKNALARAYRRALQSSAGNALLGYADPKGNANLRGALAKMLSSTRGFAATSEEIMITRGSQMAIYLIAKALISPGDHVAVESLGYRPAWEALEQAGAKLIPIPVDGSGIKVDLLESFLAKKKLRAIYLTPHHQYPTTVTLTADRRIRVLALAKKHKIAIIEDDYDHEFHYEGRPILPLASTDRFGSVIYIGTMSKILAPGLRLGYIVAPLALLKRIIAHRILLDRQGDHLVEYAVAELLEEGELLRHTRRAKRVYAARRYALVTALQKKMKSILSFSVPPGGMALWAQVDPAIDVNAWSEKALSHGVAFRPGSFYSFDRKALSFVRLGFASATEKEIKSAIRKLSNLLGKIT